MQCTKPITIYPKYKSVIGQLPAEMIDGMKVPCGRCLSCRISKRSEWAIRMLHEQDSHKDSMFVTLTYDDAHLPFNEHSLYPTLVKKHLQDFFKRLRRDIAPKKIRYFACGEYGEKTLRPHYHFILFGLGLQDKDLIIQNWEYCNWDVPEIVKNSFGIAEPLSIQYVAQYIDKKLTGDLADEEYGHKKKEPVFKTSSLGIGREFVIKNVAQLQQDLCVSVLGVTHALPRYYINKAGIDIKKAKLRAETLEKLDNEKLAGIRLSETQIYRKGEINILNKINNKKRQIRSQKDSNLKAKLSLKKNRKI